MKLIILPGFSIRNKQWAEECCNFFLDRYEVIVHEWLHWESGNNGDFKIETESQKLYKLVGKENVYMIAKSIGTYVSMNLLNNDVVPVKLILCGIPSDWLKENRFDQAVYKKISTLDPEKLIVFQNSDDPYAKYDEIDAMISSLNPDIRVIEKKSDTHEYYYFEDFKEFLSAGN